jgi:hypothetical protein
MREEEERGEEYVDDRDVSGYLVVWYFMDQLNNL